MFVLFFCPFLRLCVFCMFVWVTRRPFFGPIRVGHLRFGLKSCLLITDHSKCCDQQTTFSIQNQSDPHPKGSIKMSSYFVGYFFVVVTDVKGDTVVVQHHHHDLKVEELFQEKNEQKEEKNENNLNNEIMLCNMINDNAITHESVSFPGIFILIF